MMRFRRERNLKQSWLPFLPITHNRTMGASQSTPAPPSSSSATPPPGCPMHEPSTPAASCPIDHSTLTPSQKAAFDHARPGDVNQLNNIPTLAQQPSPGQKLDLPLERTISSIPRASSSNASPSACPVAHGTKKEGEGVTGKSEEGQWEYPSPQQFYNALVRKGWETPEESVEMMVNIHNWLNEEAWSQVRKWEERHDG